MLADTTFQLMLSSTNHSSFNGRPLPPRAKSFAFVPLSLGSFMLSLYLFFEPLRPCIKAFDFVASSLRVDLFVFPCATTSKFAPDQADLLEFMTNQQELFDPFV